MKGVFGEFLVNLAAKFFLDKHIYSLLKNVTLPTEDDTTQQKTWTQKIYRHTTKFQNPLHQNYKHTQTLQTALELDPAKVFSVVVFVGESTFKTTMPDNVVYTGGYIRFIKSKMQPLLSDNEVLDICKKIQSGRLKLSIRTHINHVKHVKAIVEEKQLHDDNSCQKCRTIRQIA